MNYVNLLSILESRGNLSNELFEKYLKQQNINIGDSEISDLIKLIKKLLKENKSLNIFNGYYVGYKIPQISKEFDLLKITENSVINIELKSGANEEKIRKQLMQNKYYLDSLGKSNIYNITYKSGNDKFYILNNKKKLEEINTEKLIGILLKESPLKENLDLLFDPSEYLVSPLNNTDKFMKGEYFLTDQQEEIKKKIIELINKNKNGFYAISGKAGTGKTLLTYDIAKEMIYDEKKVLVVHCGKLNNGHRELIDKYRVELIPIKIFTEKKVDENYDLIIFDETQRIFQEQLAVILKNKKKANFLFSYDEAQTLSLKDGKYGKYVAGQLFKKRIKNHFKLSENIRTNKEIASFIKRLIDIKKDNNTTREYKNITIQNFENIELVEDYIKNLESNGWTYISYTPKMHGEKGVYQKYNIDSDSIQNAHDVIGQEFDNVAVIVGEGFLYKDIGKLTYYSSKDTSVPFMPHKMLFQAMTRVRKELKIIIVNNPEVLERCIEILNPCKETN